MSVACLEEIAVSTDNRLLPELTKRSAARKPGVTASIELDVNPKRSHSERHELFQLLDEFRGCFAGETGVDRTRVARKDLFLTTQHIPYMKHSISFP